MTLELTQWFIDHMADHGLHVEGQPPTPQEPTMADRLTVDIDPDTATLRLRTPDGRLCDIDISWTDGPHGWYARKADVRSVPTYQGIEIPDALFPTQTRDEAEQERLDWWQRGVDAARTAAREA